MIPDIPYMYDCYQASQEEAERDVWDYIFFDKLVDRVVKKLGRTLSKEERYRLEKAFFAKAQDTRPFHERKGLWYVKNFYHGEYGEIPF